MLFIFFTSPLPTTEVCNVSSSVFSFMMVVLHNALVTSSVLVVSLVTSEVATVVISVVKDSVVVSLRRKINKVQWTLSKLNTDTTKHCNTYTTKCNFLINLDKPKIS